jgi:hypothetical protein
LQKDYKKLENKLKTEATKKKAMQIKKIELEKKVLQITKGNVDDALNKIITEKETKIQDLKKKLKLPHDASVETAELKIVLEEKKNLEAEFQNAKAMVGVMQNQKEELEQEIQLLKGQVEKLSLADPNFSISSELGELIVSNLELSKLQEEFDQIKQKFEVKDDQLKETLETKEMLTQQVRLAKDVLAEAKQVIWDSLIRQIKNLKEHFIPVEDERKLATSCIANLQVLHDSLGDKPLQEQNAINVLNSRTKNQLQFEGIQDRTDLITQAKKYIIKDKMLQGTTAKAKFVLCRVSDFKVIFQAIFVHGLPNFWDEQGLFLSKEDYLEDFHLKKNDRSTFDHLSTLIKGHNIVNILEKDFELLCMMKEVILSLRPISYFFYSNLDSDSREILAISFPTNSVWQRISTFAARWMELGEVSSSPMNTHKRVKLVT